MLRLTNPWKRRTGAIVLSLAAAAIALPAVAWASPPTTYKTERVSGSQGDVACLTPHRCVVGGYNNKGVADIVVVNNGVPGHVSVIPKSQGVYGISCPNSSGCVAIIRAPGDVGTELLDINAAGVAGHTFRYTNPIGAVLFRVACVTLKSCTLGGNNINTTPNGIEIATWNGSKLTFHLLAGLAKSTDTIIEDVSCVAATCDVVGYFERGVKDVGISVLVHAGTAFKLHTVAADLLYGVSCVSQARCYAAGLTTTGGTVVALTNGALTQTTPVHSVNLYGIACTGATCVAAGQENAMTPPDIYWGAVVDVTNGHASLPMAITTATVFDGVASNGPTIAIVGDAQKAGSLVAVGQSG